MTSNAMSKREPNIYMAAEAALLAKGIYGWPLSGDGGPVDVQLSSSKEMAEVRRMLVHRGYADCQFVNTGIVQAAVLNARNHITVVFRGTDSLEDAMADSRCSLVPMYPDAGEGSEGDECLVHEGFRDALFQNHAITIITNIVRTMQEIARNGESRHRGSFKPVRVTGHSLGGALAILFAAYANGTWYHATEADASLEVPNVRHVYTFGVPRVGNERFARCYARFGPETYRFVNNNDVVTRLPLAAQGYRHVGDAVYITPSGRARINPVLREVIWYRILGWIDGLLKPGLDDVRDHSMREYFDAVWNVRRNMTAKMLKRLSGAKKYGEPIQRHRKQ